MKQSVIKEVPEDEQTEEEDVKNTEEQDKNKEKLDDQFKANIKESCSSSSETSEEEKLQLQ